MKTVNHLGTDPIGKLVPRIAFPSMLAQFVSVLYSIVDRMYIGHIASVGDLALAGVGVCGPILTMIGAFSSLIGVGGAPLLGIRLGEKNEKEASRILANAFLMLVSLSLVLTAAALFLTRPMLMAFGASTVTYPYARAYFMIYVSGSVFALLSTGLNQFVICQGFASEGMKSVLLGAVLNLLLDPVFIFVLHLGVRGAAIATVLSRFVECAIVITWTHRHKERNRFIVGAYETMRVPPELARQIVRLGAPLLINELLWSGGMAMLNQCYSMRGLEVVSACNISSTVSNLFLCAALSMGNTVAIIVGQLLGAGELERAVDEDRKLIAFSVALSTCVGIVMALLAPLLPQLYNTSDSVKQMASDMLWVSAAMMPFNAFTNTCYFTLRSGGKTIITFIFDSAYIWAICIPVAFTLSRYTTLPILPMFMIVQSLEILKCGIGFVFVKRRKWVNNLVTDPTI